MSNDGHAVLVEVIAHAEALAPDLTFFRASDPDSLIPGTKWRERILLEMDRAALAVFFVSPKSIGRPWLNFELGYIEKSIGTSVVCVTIDGPGRLNNLYVISCVAHEYP